MQIQVYAAAESVAREAAQFIAPDHGASAPLKELQRKFGFEPDHVIAAVKEQLANSPGWQQMNSSWTLAA